MTSVIVTGKPHQLEDFFETIHHSDLMKIPTAVMWSLVV